MAPFLIHFPAMRRNDSEPSNPFGQTLLRLTFAPLKILWLRTLRTNFRDPFLEIFASLLQNLSSITASGFKSSATGEKSTREQIEACTFCLFCASKRWLCIPTSDFLRFFSDKNPGELPSQRRNPAKKGGWGKIITFFTKMDHKILLQSTQVNQATQLANT